MSFISSALSLLRSECYLPLVRYHFYRRFISHFSCRFLSYLCYLFSPIFLPLFFLIMSLSIVFFRSVLSSAFGKSAKDRCFRIDTDVLRHYHHDGRPKSCKLSNNLRASRIEPNDFQRCCYVVNLNCGFSSNLMIIKTVVVHNNSVFILYPYEFHRASMDKVLDILTDLSRYGTYVWD